MFCLNIYSNRYIETFFKKTLKKYNAGLHKLFKTPISDYKFAKVKQGIILLTIYKCTRVFL